ncbi:MAG: DUF4261 domain-containing protein, partial [Planctomycetaceae bacterium]|nr:DUF4261 domain-containing protein [Planctomycetaceae bacterium]
AEQEVKQHKFHWIVTVNADLEPIPLSTLLTQVTSAALAACDAAIGTYWGNATLVLPKKTFVDVATGTLPDELPLLLWVDFRIGPDSEKTSAGFTAGMRALGHMDLETEHATESPRDLYERLVSLADYVLTNGPVIKDGDTVGQDAHEKIRVVYSDSTFGHEEKVMRLVYGKGYDKKPRWKFW